MPDNLHVALRVTLLEPVLSGVCPCCGRGVEAFEPMPVAYFRECEANCVEHPLDAWETLNLEAYLCPQCGASDRDRLQAAYLSSRIGQGPHRILEIAPSRPVGNWLRRQPGVQYRSADLYMSSADDRVDIADMACYADDAFDIVICSHVLEHIPDDLKAMHELRRILAPDGEALLLVPISKIVAHVEEDPGLEDESERWRRFGQGDHVRIYGREGFVSRLRQSGFEVEPWSPEEAIQRCFGLGEGSTLYVGR